MVTFEQVVEFLTANKDVEDVKTFLTELVPSKAIDANDVLTFIGTDEGKIAVQPMMDQAITKAVKTRDKAHEQTLEAEVKRRVAAEVLKLNPEEEPWKKEIRVLNDTIEQEKKARAKDQMKRQLVEMAAKIGVDPFFVDDYTPDSIEQGELYLKKYKDSTNAAIEKAINERMAQAAFKPGAGDDRQRQKGTILASEYAKIPFEQRIAMVESGEVGNVVPD